MRIRQLFRALCIVLTPIMLITSGLVFFAPAQTGASSHREAPLIAYDPQADTTDVYAFISPDRPDSVTLMGNWIPLQPPYGGPNFHQFGDDVRYEIHVDNVGDARSRIIYRFEFTTTTRNPETFLYNVGPITTLDDQDWNVTQVYTVTEILSPTTGPMVTTTLASGLRTPPVHIGSKSTPDYAALANAATYVINGNASSPEHIKVFAGQRDDPFFVDLGSVFDLLTLRGQAPPVGYSTGLNFPIDGVAGYNVHTIALQVPISRLLRNAPDGETVIGVWATSSRRSMRVLSPLGGVAQSGAWVQVSRLSMPLVNEAVIPRALKDAFNGLQPEQDFGLFTSGTPAGNLLQKSVLDPELQRLLQALYGVPNPGTNRTDILAIFLTGMKTTKPFTITVGDTPTSVPAGTNVNQPQTVQPAEMIRLNTAPAFRPGVDGSLCADPPNYALGVLGGDVCGFPNGRRLQDDVTDIELLAVAGAAYGVLTDDTFNFNPALIGVLRDRIDRNDKPFLTTFPYVPLPHRGQEPAYQLPRYTFAPFTAR